MPRGSYHLKPGPGSHRLTPFLSLCGHPRILASFRRYVLPSVLEDQEGASTSGKPGCVAVGDMLVREAGPLAEFSLVMDAAARRVLPGHLLRR